MKDNKIKFIDGATLKIIAVISMILDHVNKAILYPLLNDSTSIIISNIIDVLGRFAFPIYAFLLVEGFKHTKSRKKYLINLVIFALISEIPFNLFTTSELINTAFQNILFTFALALITIWIIDVLKKKIKWWYVLVPIITVIGSFLAELLALDYGFYGVLVPVVLYLFYDKRLISTILGWLCIIKEIWTWPAFLLLNFYNGKRGKQLKWLFYAVYPVHLLILGIIRLVMGI